jgi:hypothetical protein
MPDAKSRARLERLLRGDFRPDDLTHLILFARDHCDGRESIADVGHFIAHHDERDRGIITRSTREFAATVQYHTYLSHPERPARGALDLNRLPPAAREYFRIAVKIVPARDIKKETTLKPASAYKMLLQLADKLTNNDDGTWSFPKDAGPTEIALAKCVSSRIIIKPAFTPTRLVDDFIDTIKSNGLITNDEIHTNHDMISTLIQLYAIAIMHNSQIVLENASRTRLELRVDMEQKKSGIAAFADIGAKKDGSKVEAATFMFSTELDPKVHCSESLVAAIESGKGGEIELDVNKQLSLLC